MRYATYVRYSALLAAAVVTLAACADSKPAAPAGKQLSSATASKDCLDLTKRPVPVRIGQVHCTDLIVATNTYACGDAGVGKFFSLDFGSGVYIGKPAAVWVRAKSDSISGMASQVC